MCGGAVRSKRTYCSRACAGAGRRGTRQPAISAALKGRTVSEASRARMSAAAKGRDYGYLRGPRHYNWKGGVATRPSGGRRSPEYWAWQRQVLARDAWTCQCCGYRNPRGWRLNAHHVRPWAEYPALRFDIANGLTLCRSCHVREHGNVPFDPATPAGACACGCGGSIPPEKVHEGVRYLPKHSCRVPSPARSAAARRLGMLPRSPAVRQRLREAAIARDAVAVLRPHRAIAVARSAATRKGRPVVAHQGERNGNAHLTWPSVDSMRAALAAPDRRWGIYSRLARQYGITDTQVRRIESGESWPPSRHP